MKKIIIAVIALAVFCPASFGFASFDDVKTGKYLNKYIEEKLKEAKDKQDEENNFIFAPWNYDLHKYAEEFRSEISTMEIRIHSRFYLSEKYKRQLDLDKQEKDNFESARNYFSMISQFSKMNDAQVIFYVLTLYKVNQMGADRQKEAEKYLENNDTRFASFNENTAFTDKERKEELKSVMVRVKRVNRILGGASSGDGGDFVNFCALLSHVFK